MKTLLLKVVLLITLLLLSLFTIKISSNDVAKGWLGGMMYVVGIYVITKQDLNLK